MGGATAPSTKLVNTPPPGQLYPNISQQFQSMVAGGPGAPGLGPQSASSLSSFMQTGNPTDVGPAYEAMVAASKRQVGIGEQNLLESFGQMGLRSSSSAMQADVDYQSQVSKDFADILSKYTLASQEGARGRQLSAAQTGFGQFALAGTTTYPTAALATGGSPLGTIGGLAQGGAESLILMAALGLI
jgi:hypothetical protein